MTAPIRAFVTYAWENEQYRHWVQRLAARLRADGVDVRLDAWHIDGRTLTAFMNSEIRNADKILMLCSPRYRQRVHAIEDGQRVSGAGWESCLITGELFSQRKSTAALVPVLTRGEWSDSAPSWVENYPRIDFREPTYERYLEVVRLLTGNTAMAPPLGALPTALLPVPVLPLFSGHEGGERLAIPRHEWRRVSPRPVPSSGPM